MLHVLHVYDIMIQEVLYMKLWFDKRLKDPTYYGHRLFLSSAHYERF